MPPYLLLSLLIGASYGTLFHLWRGKTMRDLTIYLLTGIIGFGLGQGLATVIDTGVFMIGPLHLIEATVTCWLSLFLMQWLKIWPPPP